MIDTKLTPHSLALSHYLSEYQRAEKNCIDTPEKRLFALRQAAIQHLSKRGFPNLKHPDWKYTSLIPFLQVPFTMAAPTTPTLENSIETASSPYRLVFINGFFSHSLSKTSALPNNARLTHLANIITHHPECLSKQWPLSTHHEKNSFIQLNTAFMHDGAYVYIPKNTQLTSPIELLFITTNDNHFTPIRNIIIAEKNSRAVIIEKYISLNTLTAPCFNNTVSECFLAEESCVEHYKLIDENKKTIHIGNILVEQQAKSEFSAYSIALQGALIRSDISLKLCQAKARCHLKGLYSAQGKQHIAQQTIIDHASPDTHSTEFYKGIIDGHARAVFDGKLIVREKAIKSSAQQLNKNLLLSAAAEVITKPQLEIFADDIFCTHGASIGQLDETALFYLRARGLTETNARSILIKAFIRDILQQMPLLNTYSFLSHSLKKLLAIDYETI
ncbi:MAG: Fe-S cluster assembly protein SufD [Rickettsiella sp.]|nr:Fe-S cluster assembly protein SufD [Rickettsiella sp.]